MGLHPAELSKRAELVKERWEREKGLSKAHLKHFGSSRPHFYRVLKGQVPVEYGDTEMLQYLSEIFEIDVVQLFDTVPDRVWPTVHLAPTDYVEAPLKDQAAAGARYLFPVEQLADCPMHHLYLELDAGGNSGLHRHFEGTEMMRLDEGDRVELQFPTRSVNRREVALGNGEIIFFDATLPHQVSNIGRKKARIFISRNYRLDEQATIGQNDGHGS
jgi:hypothetical protein